MSFLLVTLFLFTLYGCGANSSSSEQNSSNQINLSSENSAFSGGFLKSFGRSILTGSSSGAASKAIGVLLSILGFGEDNTEELKTLNNILSKLNDVDQQLTDIKNAINEINKEIKINHNDIIANCNDPTEAIDKISSLWMQLSNDAQQFKPGKMPRSEVDQFIDQVNNTYNIPYQVDRIFYSIMPQSSAKTPILNNYRKLNVNKYEANVSQFFTRMKGYINLENYTSQLVANQLRGVSLVVNAKNAQAKENNTSSDGGVYFQNFYNNELKKEIWDIDNGESFFANALYYTWDLSNIYDEQDRNYFKSNKDTQTILKRADFFRRMIMLSYPYTSRDTDTSSEYQPAVYLMILAQKDFDPCSFYKVQDGSDFLDCYVTESLDPFTGIFPLSQSAAIYKYTIKGSYYASWKGNSAQVSNDYNLYLVKLIDTPDTLPISEIFYIWPRRNNTSEYKPNNALLKIDAYRYDDNYTKTDNGPYFYGFGFLFERDNNHLLRNQSYWEYDHINSTGNVNFGYTFDYNSHSLPDVPSGVNITLPSGYTGVLAYVKGNKEDQGYDTPFSAEGDLKVKFSYTGSQKLKVKIYYDAYLFNYTEAYYDSSNYAFGIAKAKITIGIHDSTSNTDTNSYSLSTESNSKGVVFKKERLTNSFEYTLTPGHKYYIYFKLYISGNAQSPLEQNERALSYILVHQIDFQIPNN